MDNKDKAIVAESDIGKLVRDAKERSTPVALLVTREESQLRQVDKESRWGRKDGVWILRTTRQWLPRDLDVLRPLLERMRRKSTLRSPSWRHKEASRLCTNTEGRCR